MIFFNEDNTGWVIAFFFLLFAVVGLGPLVIHVIWCVQLASENWIPLVLLIAGLVVPPVGWVHGMSILLGFGGWL